MGDFIDLYTVYRGQTYWENPSKNNKAELVTVWR